MYYIDLIAKLSVIIMEYSDAYNNNYYNQNTDQLSHKVLSDIYPL